MGATDNKSARLDRALDRLEAASKRVAARRVADATDAHHVADATDAHHVADATDARLVADVKARLDTAIADIRSLLEG